MIRSLVQGYKAFTGASGPKLWPLGFRDGCISSRLRQAEHRVRGNTSSCVLKQPLLVRGHSLRISVLFVRPVFCLFARRWWFVRACGVWCGRSALLACVRVSVSLSVNLHVHFTLAQCTPVFGMCHKALTLAQVLPQTEFHLTW